jgi:hypothetical protein
VLYASHTENAMDAAERIGREAEHGGCPSVEVLFMVHVDPVSDLSIVCVLLISSFFTFFLFT